MDDGFVAAMFITGNARASGFRLARKAPNGFLARAGRSQE
jgi:hypothetical protein